MLWNCKSKPVLTIFSIQLIGFYTNRRFGPKQTMERRVEMSRSLRMNLVKRVKNTTTHHHHMLVHLVTVSIEYPIQTIPITSWAHNLNSPVTVTPALPKGSEKSSSTIILVMYSSKLFFHDAKVSRTTTTNINRDWNNVYGVGGSYQYDFFAPTLP